MGRSGKLFAHEWAGVAPDVMTVAKALGNGFPVGACLATAKAAVGMTAGTHGSTYGGNPLAMSAGNAVLDVMLAEGFLENVERIAGHLKQQLAGLVSRNPDMFEDARGSGLLLGLKCKVPNQDMILAVRKQGLLTAGAGDNVMRILAPLIVTAEHVSEAVEKIDAACADLRAHAAAAARKAG
jgi:acetylornithine/N-succinyldiaminopimelate aminotransferase